MLFGIANGSWTFVFSVIPLVMFMRNWLIHDERQELARRKHYAEFADILAAAHSTSATEYGD